jgi:transcriptional regulator of arginine metabolism
LYNYTIMNKTERLLEIRKIIQTKKISSQDELLGILNEKGFSYTQATLSRDLKYLKAGKMPDDEKGMVYVLPDTTGQNPSSPGNIEVQVDQPAGFISVEYTSNTQMAVIKTLPGFASSLAYRIDGMNAFEIIGTIAGDDTILVIGREGIPRPALVQSLRPMLS